jgi:adenylate cyclase
MFFSDIASFTTIVESMPPESSLLLLSRYFNDMSKVIDSHGGVVIEFIGDAILCIYGAPLPIQDHPTQGVKASLGMLAALKKMNRWSLSKELPEVKIRCGVHTGRVLVGNMGFHSRMKYGIVGEDAHIPSRLEEINKTYGTNMMISASTWKRLDRSTYLTRPIDYVNLRQTSGAASEPIYQVLDRERERKEDKRHALLKESETLKHPLWDPVKSHATAMDLYRRRDFEAALQMFMKVNQTFFAITGSDDEASQVMINRCESYIEQPPSVGWDGLWERGGS